MGRRSKQAAHTMEKNFFAASKSHPPLGDSSGPPLPFGAEASRSPFTYRGPNTGENPAQRLHREFKSLSKEERQRLVEEEAADTDLLARTVHLRFLPTGMLQGELAALCAECGEYLRVRICGNSTNAQNWIYGFVEFADRRGAEKMLRRSGMELPNGQGRPPLRLKCNAAKQAIVDRVFHDANPATKMACIFGSGNFACRTLKEAVDSYYNLKRKEGGMMATHTHPQNSSRSSNTNTNNSNMNNNANIDNETSNGNGNGIWHPPAPRHYTKSPDSPASSLYPPAQAGYRSRSVSNSDEESAGITPLLHVSTTNGNGTIPADSLLPPPFYAQAAQPMSIAQQFGARGNHDGRSDGTASCDGKVSPPLVSPFTGILNGFHTSCSLLPSPQDPIVDRGKALVVVAMQGARAFATTGEHFYDAVGALRALLNILDSHGWPALRLPNTKDVSHTLEGLAMAEGDEEGKEEDERTQRVMQLRLLAYLLLSLLFLEKGNNEESLASIHSAVFYCNSIPVTRLQRTCSSASPMVTATLTKSRAVCEPAVKGTKSEEAEEEVLPIGFDISGVEETHCTFNPISQAFDFFDAIDVGGEEEQESTLLNDLALALRLDEDEAPLERLQARNEQKYERDVHIQAFVLNVLLTIGLSVEVAHPVVTRCVYVLAANRSKEVFGATLSELEQTLLEGGVHRLRSVLFPQVEDHNFVKTFLQSLDGCEAMMDEGFWSTLPPTHMVRCFPLPSVDISC